MSIQKKPIRGRSAASRKRKLLRKSRYYQKSCQKLYLAAGVGIFVFVFILILAGIKGCGNYRHAKKAASDNVISMKATQDSASDSADTVSYTHLDEIAALEEKLEKLDKDMEANATNSMKLREIMEEKENTQQKLDEKMDRWVYLNDLAERIQAQKV